MMMLSRYPSKQRRESEQHGCLHVPKPAAFVDGSAEIPSLSFLTLANLRCALVRVEPAGVYFDWTGALTSGCSFQPYRIVSPRAQRVVA
jgi:hypothetical protein